MPYTRRQLNRILNVGGRPFIDPEHPVPYSMRVCESLIRRRLYALEDEAVNQQWHMYRAAYTDIRNRAMDLAQQYGVSTLENNARVLSWRRQVETFAQLVAAGLADRLATHALRAAGNMYLLGYYGRAWALDMATPPNVDVRAPMPKAADITRDTLQPGMTEAFEPDKLIYDLLGQEWRQTYQDNVDEMVRKIRSTLNTSIQQNLNLTGTMQAVAEVMGVSISKAQGFKANFNRIQALTRTYTMNAANEGALNLYMQNAPLVTGVQFLAAHDARVCPTCNRLQGTIWTIDSPDLVRPPVHVNCRCTLIPVLIQQGNITIPPAQTWQQWLLAAGLGWLLDDLADIDTGDDIDSTQIGDDEAELEDVF